MPVAPPKICGCRRRTEFAFETGTLVDRPIAWFLAVVAFCAGLATARADDGFRLLQIDGRDVKWGEPVLGKGANITYAVVSGQSAITGKVNCLRVGGIEPLISRSHLTRQVFERELEGALAMWQSVANVRFHAARRASTADIVIATEGTPEGIAYADVAFDVPKQGSISRLRKGIVCLNPRVQWTGGRSEPGAAGSVGQEYRLLYTLAHELGHVLGLDHPGPQGELMSFEYASKFEGLKQGDIAGIGVLYGRRIPVPVLALNSKTPSVR